MNEVTATMLPCQQQCADVPRTVDDAKNLRAALQRPVEHEVIPVAGDRPEAKIGDEFDRRIDGGSAEWCRREKLKRGLRRIVKA